MKLTILGSGTCIPSKTRGSSGYLIETTSNKILFDCGNGTTWKLAKLEIDYTDIDHIFISHLHPDHTSDLIPFLFANKYPYKNKREKDIKVWGAPGIKKFFESLYSAYNGCIQPDKLKVYELDKTDLKFNDFSITTANGLHTEQSLIYKIESNGKSVVYSGDTDYCQEIIDISKNVELLIIECSSTDDKKMKGHLTPSEIIKIAKLSNPKKIILTHLYPVCDEIDIVNLIKSEIDSEVFKAEDLMEIIM